jgi:hypothetical protein
LHDSCNISILTPCFLMESNRQHEDLTGEAKPFNEPIPAKAKEEDKEISKALQQFIITLEPIRQVEEKIQATLQFMRRSVAGAETPKFKDFFEARRLCLAFFKEAVPAKSRGSLWKEYTDLSEEARRLKMVLDEQSAFAFEQIDLAVDALFAQAQAIDEKKDEQPSLDIPPFCKTLYENKEHYINSQKLLTLLNLFAARVHALRKEVIRTEMRIRNKNKLFEKLSKTGDLIFPRRKELIISLSEVFAADVKHYVESVFVSQLSEKMPLHTLREQIKTLQQLAKDLTLNVSCFNSTRIDLSNCWDKLKELDRERKKESVLQKEQDKVAIGQAEEKLKAFEEFCATNPSFNEMSDAFDAAFASLKTLSMPVSDIKRIKSAFFEARKPFFEEKKRQDELKETKGKEAQKEKKAQIANLTSTIHKLLEDKQMSAEELEEKKNELAAAVQKSLAIGSERAALEGALQELKLFCLERKKEFLIESCIDGHVGLEAWSSLLEEFLQLKEHTKKMVEATRKLLGGSGFDFETAMVYRDLIETQKRSLEKQEISIEELQEKIER